MTRTCGECSRDIPSERLTCMYCGWEPGVGSTAEPWIPKTEFRQGTMLWRFVASTAVLLPTAVILLVTASRDQLPLFGAIAAAMLTLGPGALAVQLLRRHHGGVRLEDRGIALESGQLVPWSQVDAVSLTTGITGEFAGTIGAVASRKGGVATFLRLVVGGRAVIGMALAPMMLVTYVLMPAFGVLTPLHSRVVLTRAHGEDLVLHDVDDAWGLYLAASSKIEELRKTRREKRRRAA